MHHAFKVWILESNTTSRQKLQQHELKGKLNTKIMDEPN